MTKLRLIPAILFVASLAGSAYADEVKVRLYIEGAF